MMMKMCTIHLVLHSFTTIRLTNDYFLSQIELPGGGGFLVAKKTFELAMQCKSDSLFCRDVMRMLWSEPDLYQRSVTGQLCRRFQKCQKEGPDGERNQNRALTPTKLNAVKRKSDIVGERHAGVVYRKTDAHTHTHTLSHPQCAVLTNSLFPN